MTRVQRMQHGPASASRRSSIKRRAVANQFESGSRRCHIRMNRKRIGEDIKTVEFGWPIGMPTCRALGQGVFEVRTHLTHNRIARVLFYVDAKNRMVLLHSFIKKTQKTPDEDLALARRNKEKRAKEIQ